MFLFMYGQFLKNNFKFIPVITVKKLQVDTWQNIKLQVDTWQNIKLQVDTWQNIKLQVDT